MDLAVEQSRKTASTGAPVDNRRVVHVVRRYGEISQTFIADAVRSIDDAGWEGYIAARGAVNREVFPYPPDERLLIHERPAALARIARRLRRVPASERRAEWMAARIAAVRPALLHAHFGWMGIEALPIARRLGVPMLTSFHGTDVTVYPNLPEWTADYRRLLDGVDRVTVVSHFLEDKLRAVGFDGRIDIVAAGVRLEQLPYRGPLEPEPVARLLFIGRQTPRKALDVLLRALPLVLREHDARLTVVGDGESAAENRRLVDRLGLADKVEFLGAKPHDEALGELRKADMLVMPSRTPPSGEAEGSPVVTKEALATGVALVATVNGGTAETIPPGYRHELVGEGDVDGLASRMVHLLDRRESWETRARIGREWVEEQFAWPLLAARLGAIYEEMLAR